MTTRPTLLIIDDDAGILKLVERFAEQLGFRAVQHHSGREARAVLRDLKPDAALVDLQMPDVGGLDVLRALQEDVAVRKQRDDRP